MPRRRDPIVLLLFLRIASIPLHLDITLTLTLILIGTAGLAGLVIVVIRQMQRLQARASPKECSIGVDMRACSPLT